MDKQIALIAGGGIAGLACALGMARIGRPARVFEQQAAFTEVGAGLQMSPNGVRALRWLGAWDEVEPHCVAPSEIVVRNGRTGTVLQRIRLGAAFEKRFGAPYRVVHRGDLLAGLVVACHNRAGIDLALGKRAVAAAAGRLDFDDGHAALQGLVVACDGIRSSLRQQTWQGTAPRYRGHALYRALVPIDEVPGNVSADAVTLWLYSGGHVVHYPVSGGQAFNIVAAIDSRWTAEGWSEPGLASDLAAIFDQAANGLADILAAPRSWLRWAGYDLPELAQWTAPGLALLGDAAHATLPYLAQGAVMALEDACVLASSLATQAGEDAALCAYQAARKPRCARIQAQSRKQGGIFHASGLRAGIRDTALRLMSAEAFSDRNAWIYAWQPPG